MPKHDTDIDGDTCFLCGRQVGEGCARCSSEQQASSCPRIVPPSAERAHERPIAYFDHGPGHVA